MFAVDDYFTDKEGRRRDVQYSSELTVEILGNAQVTVDRWNLLLTHFYSENPSAKRRRINSGWRPQAINQATTGAAKGSTHLTAEALDAEDADRDLARWILGNEEAAKKIGVPSLAARIGLWFEDFRTTVSWVHGQIIPPMSLSRIYIPSNKWWARLKDDKLSLDDLQTPVTTAHL